MNLKMLTLAVVAVVAVAAVGAYFIVFDNDDDGPISIVDGSGTTITLDEPLTGVVTVNTNAPKAMKMIGLANEVKGLCFYTSSDSTDETNWNTYKGMFPEAAHMSRISSSSVLMSGEEVIDRAGVRYVLCPVSSMTVSPTTQTAFENLGITVIRLDFNGDTALDDLDKLATLFGKTKKITDALNGYLDTYNSVIDTVKDKVAAAASTSDKTFLYLMSASGGGSFYNQTAAGSKMIETAYGQNALRNINNLDISSVTNKASGETNIKEVVVNEDGRKPISMIFVRGTSTTTTETAAKNIWDGANCALSSDYTSLSAIGTDSAGKIFVFNSNFMSGPLGYIGYVLAAEACGIDTGYNVSALIEEYNEEYGFSEGTTGYLFSITIVGGVSTANAVEIV